MPLQTDLIGMYANKTLLDQEGLTVPTTLDEMVAFCGAAAEKGYIDAVIEPSQTRLELRKALAQLRDKRVPRTPRKNYLMPI